MGEYFNAVADAFDLPHPRVTWRKLERGLPPELLSFMAESRLTRARLRELGCSFAIPRWKPR
jgi:hypothetical protein